MRISVASVSLPMLNRPPGKNPPPRPAKRSTGFTEATSNVDAAGAGACADSTVMLPTNTRTPATRIMLPPSRLDLRPRGLVRRRHLHGVDDQHGNGAHSRFKR